MGTRSLTLTEDEWRQVAILINNEEHDADNRRMLTRPGSPQEKAAEADQAFLQGIQAKLTVRESVTPAR